MRIRLARKVLKNPKRYVRGKVENAMIRLGWKKFHWRIPFTVRVVESTPSES